MVPGLTLADLVANGTMSMEIAATLRSAVAARCSFLVFARPRLAGKSTMMGILIELLPRGVPVLVVGEDGVDVASLAAEARSGYLVVPEVSRHAVAPGYIWGEPVRRAFHAMAEGCSLAVALHADDPAEALEIVGAGSGVPADDLARLGILVHLRSLGTDWRAPERRVVAAVYEVESGRPVGTRALHRWDERADRFETVASPSRFAAVP